MQVSEIYRRGIVLAATPLALKSLRDNNIELDTQVSCVPISETLFERLWAGAFVRDLNNACGTSFDDHEQDFLPHGQLDVAIRLLDDRMVENADVEMMTFCENLRSLLQEAKSRGYPVLFVF
jgi:hypothetical protein